MHSHILLNSAHPPGTLHIGHKWETTALVLWMYAASIISVTGLIYPQSGHFRWKRLVSPAFPIPCWIMAGEPSPMRENPLLWICVPSTDVGALVNWSKMSPAARTTTMGATWLLHAPLPKLDQGSWQTGFSEERKLALLKEKYIFVLLFLECDASELIQLHSLR